MFSCFLGGGYSVVFTRVYAPENCGVVDENGVANVLNAHTGLFTRRDMPAANLGIEVYVTPQPSGCKPGYQQFEETYVGLQNSGIGLRALWLQVVFLPRSSC